VNFDIDVNVDLMTDKTFHVNIYIYIGREMRKDLDTSSEASSQCERVTRCVRERMLKDNRSLLSLNEIDQSLSTHE